MKDSSALMSALMTKCRQFDEYLNGIEKILEQIDRLDIYGTTHELFGALSDEYKYLQSFIESDSIPTDIRQRQEKLIKNIEDKVVQIDEVVDDEFIEMLDELSKFTASSRAKLGKVYETLSRLR